MSGPIEMMKMTDDKVIKSPPVPIIKPAIYVQSSSLLPRRRTSMVIAHTHGFVAWVATCEPSSQRKMKMENLGGEECRRADKNHNMEFLCRVVIDGVVVVTHSK